MSIAARMICCVTLLPMMAIGAQSDGTLGVQGTAAYALIWNRLASNPLSQETALSGRFNGRIAVGVSARIFAGLTVGSYTVVLQQQSDDPQFGDPSAAVATAVFVSPYLQWYPYVSSALFVRGGLGLARTATYTPSPQSSVPAPLVEERRTRVTGSIGTGYDFPLRQHLALTFSVDYTRLFGADAAFEPLSALLVGIGITVR